VASGADVIVARRASEEKFDFDMNSRQRDASDLRWRFTELGTAL